MKLEKKIAKLLSEHELAVIIDQIVLQTDLPKVLLQISNRLCFKAGSKDKSAKTWIRRAKVVHAVMEEIIEEERLSKME